MGADFTFDRHGIVFIVSGPSGAGKSTLFKLIVGLYPPTKGTIVFDSIDITEERPFARVQRGVLGFGSEAIGTDAGQGYHLRPPYPCHYFMHGAGRYGLQCLAQLDQLPPTGSLLICPPLKIGQGSGSPLRVLALVAT